MSLEASRSHFVSWSHNPLSDGESPLSPLGLRNPYSWSFFQRGFILPAGGFDDVELQNANIRTISMIKAAVWEEFNHVSH